MSIKVMSAAWEQTLTPATKLVLMALADIADDSGVCWPSIRRLAGKCCLSERAVRTHLADLEGRGLLKVERRFRSDGSQTSNRYVVLDGVTPAAGSAPLDEQQRKEAGAHVQAPSDEGRRPLNHQGEPSTETPQQPTMAADELINFKFPDWFPEFERAEATRRLRALGPSDGQLVLDELAGRAQSRELRNPLGYLRKLIGLSQAGEFQPDMADRVRDHRETRERHLAAMQRREEELRASRGPVKMDHLPPRLQEMLRKHVRTADEVERRQSSASDQG